MRTTLAALSLLTSLASANPAPLYPGLQLLWSDAFDGSPGQSPNRANWNIITDVRTNNELQTYTPASTNLQLTGGSTIQLIPRRNPSTGAWTSARIESRHVFTPAPNRLTAVEAAIRLGSNPPHTRQGLWPAFWLLGDSIHHGTEWPICGELDILENVSGAPVVHGTLHCGRTQGQGGPCNEPIGRGTATELGGFEGWHTWRLEIDRRDHGGGRGWRGETVRWLKDGREWFVVRGEEIGDEGVWAALTHSPLFIILNVAVGGDWPGYPNDATLDGYGSMMEVDYVAVYQGDLERLKAPE
ncbi:hypothetical protein VTJ49DRAFT_3767 [Mycothermus thermophilus]|uniref:GH16 domain-containing protein n=1 Tax=Humicola insolens TaxID=85995 RepID=A0ABR3V6P9_HUMIN